MIEPKAHPEYCFYYLVSPHVLAVPPLRWPARTPGAEQIEEAPSITRLSEKLCSDLRERGEL